MKRNIKLLALLIGLMITITTTQAQVNNFRIEFKDGTSMEGTSDMPVMMMDKEINIDTKDGEKWTLSADEIKTIILIGEKEEIEFEQIETLRRAAKKKKNKNKKKKKTVLVWASKYYEKGDIIGYFALQRQQYGQPNSGGALRSYSVYRTAYFMKFKSDKYVVPCGIVSPEKDPFHGFDKMMRKQFKRIIADRCPDFEKTMKKKKYQVEDIEKMFDDYNVECGGK